MYAALVVPTRDRPDLLSHCLDSVMHQSIEACAYQIIVVDDSPRRSAEPLVRRLCQESQNLSYLSTGGRGPAAARNAGWRAASADIIAFIDDDCIADTNWLEVGMCALTADVAAVGGAIRVPLRSSPTDYERNAAQLEGAEFATANCFIRRCALERVHGFDERFAMAWREDTDLYFRLLDAGLRVTHVPGACVRHPIRPAGWGVSLAQQRKSEFNALLYKKHPVRYHQIQSRPPLGYYATIGSAMLMLLPQLREDLRKLSAILWILLTARFCCRRLVGNSKTISHAAEMITTSACIPFVAVFWRVRGALRFKVLFL